MNIAEAFMDYMNGSISKQEYLDFYPAEQRHFVRIPKRKSIEREPCNYKGKDCNPIFIKGQELEPYDYLKRLKYIGNTA